MALATTTDVETRLGRSLTAAEEAMAEQVLELVEGMILEITGADEPSPVPLYYKALCIEKVIMVGTNPNGLASESETLGAHSHSRTFQRASDIGVFLTDSEERTIRRIANNKVSGSSRPHSLPHDVYVTEDA
jgi:hypothetical protein